MSNALLLEPATLESVVSSSTATGRRATNVARDPMGLVWRSATGSASQWLRIDLGADVPIDTILLLGLGGTATLGDIEWTVDLATDAQGAFTGSYWAGDTGSLLAGEAMPQSGKGKALWLAPAGAPATARHVRIMFNSLSNASIEVARAVICQRIQLERNFRFGAALGVRPLGEVDFSARGVLLRRRGAKLRGIGISFPHVRRDEIEEKVQPLQERVGNDVAIAIVTDPDAHEQRQKRIYFGFLTGDIGAVWARPGGFQAEFNLVALD